MNNTWETNFKMDLSGFSEFRYGVEIVEQGTAEKDMESLSDNDKGVGYLYLRVIIVPRFYGGVRQ